MSTVPSVLYTTITYESIQHNVNVIHRQQQTGFNTGANDNLQHQQQLLHYNMCGGIWGTQEQVYEGYGRLAVDTSTWKWGNFVQQKQLENNALVERRLRAYTEQVEIQREMGSTFSFYTTAINICSTTERGMRSMYIYIYIYIHVHVHTESKYGRGNIQAIIFRGSNNRHTIAISQQKVSVGE